MRILLLSPANSTHTVRWANALLRKNNEVYVVSCNDHREADDKFDKWVHVIYLNYNSGLGYYLNAHQLKKVVKRISPDVINVHYASGYGTLARIAHLKKYLLNVWGSDVFIFPKESSIKRHILTKNLKNATLLASTSNSMADEAKKYVDGRYYITPFGVELSKYKSIEKKSEKFIFCTVKSLSPVYGIIGIIDAFNLFLEKMKSTNPDLIDNIEYHIYGKGPQYQEIKDHITKLKLEDKVFLKGYIPNKDVPSVIGESDVFLLKSLSESFGVAAIEAMACYKPVIASNVSGFLEVIEDGVSGIIVDKDNIEQYADTMVSLFFDKEKREFLGKNGRLRVEKYYDWDKNVNDMLGVYKELMRV